jgi:hypothetical protein
VWRGAGALDTGWSVALETLLKPAHAVHSHFGFFNIGNNVREMK